MSCFCLSTASQLKDGVTHGHTDGQPEVTTQSQIMAPMSLLFLGLLLSFLHPTDAQTVIGSSSSFSLLDPPVNLSPPPTKQSARFWPSLPPKGRSDVPIRAAAPDRQTTTDAAQQGRRSQSSPPFVSAHSTQKNLSSGPVLPHPTASRPRTDTASLALSRASLKGDATVRSSTPPVPTLPFAAVSGSAGDEPAAAWNPSLKESEGDDLPELGSGSVPTATPVNEESPAPPTTVFDEMAQHQPQAQTATSEELDVETPPPPTEPQLSGLTTAGKTSTSPQTETRAPPRAAAFTGEEPNIPTRERARWRRGQILYAPCHMCRFPTVV